jgi:hypothetical protein
MGRWKNIMFYIYFFGSASCKSCRELLKAIVKTKLLKVKGIEYKFIDALADENQAMCDEHGVDEIPHVKVFKNNNLIFEEIGWFEPIELWKVIFPDNADCESAMKSV